ncbi:hypothetical protein [Brucella pseudogrignonensis]|uniref:CR-type domain-containing protein n=1 Tax=Brucella pseudogrignonensis TaxID=419475 RepID=A0ABU1MF02_9HYPH|nr:hypothetical protein [Brucella pseudogrignonensis]MDR6434617.1 hypothetical protein [Brucella pseudogrignonensis]
MSKSEIDQTSLKDNVGPVVGKKLLKKEIDDLFKIVGGKSEITEEQFSLERMESEWLFKTTIATEWYTSRYQGRIQSNAPRFNSHGECLSVITEQSSAARQEFNNHSAIHALIRQGKINQTIDDYVAAIRELRCDPCDGTGSLYCNNCSGEGTCLCNHCNATGYKFCYSCSGTGIIHNVGDNSQHRCGSCNAQGKVRCNWCDWSNFQYRTRCLSCNGGGKFGCNTCARTGWHSDCYSVKVIAKSDVILKSSSNGLSVSDKYHQDDQAILDWIRSAGLDDNNKSYEIEYSFQGHNYTDLRVDSAILPMQTGLSLKIYRANYSAKHKGGEINGTCILISNPVYRFNKFLEREKDELHELSSLLSRQPPKDFASKIKEVSPEIFELINDDVDDAVLKAADRQSHGVLGSYFLKKIYDDYVKCRNDFTKDISGRMVVLPLISAILLWFIWVVYLPLPWEINSGVMAIYLIMPFIASFLVIRWNTMRIIAKQTGKKSKVKFGGKTYIVPLFTSLGFLVLWYLFRDSNIFPIGW